MLWSGLSVLHALWFVKPVRLSSSSLFRRIYCPACKEKDEKEKDSPQQREFIVRGQPVGYCDEERLIAGDRCVIKEGRGGERKDMSNRSDPLRISLD